MMLMHLKSLHRVEEPPRLCLRRAFAMQTPSKPESELDHYAPHLVTAMPLVAYRPQPIR